ncbi:MAG: hypothetical protein OXH45_00830 [Gammaproteobacteria bacterium]|nr:hypothetical protein [Gammaproteobacteria bacterium]
METFPTPPGKAGWDQLHGLTESVQSELEQMFSQRAKLDSLISGVGRAADWGGSSDDKIMLDAQMRECQAQAAFHAGRALELAMHIVYACGTDRIMGREYPSADRSQLDKQMAKDRKSHNLAGLLDKIAEAMPDRNMRDALEEVYQEALHRGIVDLYLDGKRMWSFFQGDDAPLSERSMNRIFDGAEMTLDHTRGSLPFGDLSSEPSEFAKMPIGTFGEFLRKADSFYYESDVSGMRMNMRYSHYAARDHEYGRPFVVVGTKFFARLIAGIVGLSRQPWTWDPAFRARWHERRQRNVSKNMETHLNQSFKEEIELPEMKTLDEMESVYGIGRSGQSFRKPKTYKLLHKKWELESKDPLN